jgi:hypothetical protein
MRFCDLFFRTKRPKPRVARWFIQWISDQSYSIWPRPAPEALRSTEFLNRRLVPRPRHLQLWLSISAFRAFALQMECRRFRVRWSRLANLMRQSWRPLQTNLFHRCMSGHDIRACRELRSIDTSHARSALQCGIFAECEIVCQSIRRQWMAISRRNCSGHLSGRNAQPGTTS